MGKQAWLALPPAPGPYSRLPGSILGHSVGVDAIGLTGARISPSLKLLGKHNF